MKQIIVCARFRPVDSNRLQITSPMGETTGWVGGRDLGSSGSSLTRAGYFITLAYAMGM
jgi:hypothetical protein